MRKVILTSLIALLTFNLVAASGTVPVSANKKDSVSAYDKLFKKKHEIAKGMFTLHKLEGKVYFEIPLTMLGKEMLMASTTAETSDNGNGIVGGKQDPLHIAFTKSGESIQLRKINCDVITDNPTSNMAKAIQMSHVGAILKNMKIEAYSNDSSAVVVNMTGFFVADNKDLSPFDKYSEYTMASGCKRVENFQQDKSFLGDIKAFSDNLVVSSTLSYTYTLTDIKTNKTVVKDAPFSAMVSRSIVLLKDRPVRPRMADYRVAVFTTGKYLFGEKEQSSRMVYYANRWNLVPKDLEAFRSGKPSEPVKPIVFYIDNSFPEKWKPSIKAGVEQWNEIFEEIGFKNVIKAVDFPTDDPEFDPDNIKYSCIRYAPIGIQNAMGPSWVDPRSGEIINASVYVYHDIIKLLNNWMMVQISPADERVRARHIPDDMMRDGIRYVVAHEVGHCLGFMHNMSASHAIPVDSLRSASFTNKTGTTTSIMDYARFNYVAQAGDKEKGVKLTPPRFGEYDKFLVKWNYGYFPDSESSEQEAKLLSDMVSEAIKNPVYRYGKQLSYPLDPRAQVEDLGDDAVRASDYGIRNLKFVVEHLDNWVGTDDEDFDYRAEIYDGIVMQYLRYINHVFAYVGGVYLNEVKVGDPMLPYESVERQTQKEALAFVMHQVKDMDWLDNENLVNKLPIMGSAKKLLQAVVIRAFLQAPAKVLLSASLSKDPYGFKECSEDVFHYVWEPTVTRRKLTDVEKYMQTEYVDMALSQSNIAKLVSGVGISESSRISLYEILKSEDKSGRFVNRLYPASAMESCAEAGCPYNPTAGYGVPSTKFNIVFNTESNYYQYLSKVKKVLESAVRSRALRDDKLHYELLLKKINAVLKIQ